MTDQELDAMVRAIDYSTRDPETGDDLHPGVFVHLSVEDAIAASVAITTLRAQLAEAMAVVEDALECEKLAADKAVEYLERADRAEAALAALIEVIAQTREKALREAAEVIRAHGVKYMTAHDAILALISPSYNSTSKN